MLQSLKTAWAGHQDQIYDAAAALGRWTAFLAVLLAFAMAWSAISWAGHWLFELARRRLSLPPAPLVRRRSPRRGKKRSA